MPPHFASFPTHDDVLPVRCGTMTLWPNTVRAQPQAH